MDYRKSHLTRGDCYDERLATTPFDAYMARREAASLKAIVPRLIEGTAGRYLDFACGTGRITATVCPLVTEAVGVDISESMLAQARQKCPAARFVCVDLTRDVLDIGRFDLATSFRFFGNAQQELRETALRALGARLQPGGYLIINNHRNPRAIASLLHRMTGGVDELDLTHAKLAQLLRAFDFRIVEAHPIAFWVFRSGLQNSPRLEGRLADHAERVFSSGVFVPWSPDCIVVAQKR